MNYAISARMLSSAVLLISCRVVLGGGSGFHEDSSYMLESNCRCYSVVLVSLSVSHIDPQEAEKEELIQREREAKERAV